jgi:hypothetical protein
MRTSVAEALQEVSGDRVVRGIGAKLVAKPLGMTPQCG